MTDANLRQTVANLSRALSEERKARLDAHERTQRELADLRRRIEDLEARPVPSFPDMPRVWGDS